MPITDEMLLWKPEEARAYFSSHGKPPADVVSKRSLDDRIVESKCGEDEWEVCLCVFCPCCNDTIIMIKDKWKADKEKKAAADIVAVVPSTVERQ